MSAPDGLARAPTLPGRLLEHADRRPGGVALRDKRLGIWHEMTWAGYARAAAAVAHALHDLGVRAGDHVAILSDNRPEWLFADLAAQGLGARSVGVYQTNPPDDVAFVLSHSQCRVVVCEDQEQVDKVVAVAAQTPTVEHVVVLEPRGTRGYEDPRLLTWESLAERGEAARLAAPRWFADQVAALDPRAPAMVVYTSGTTGQPKGAMLSSANALAVPDGMIPVLGASAEDQILRSLALPLLTLEAAVRGGGAPRGAARPRPRPRPTPRRR